MLMQRGAERTETELPAFGSPRLNCGGLSQLAAAAVVAIAAAAGCGTAAEGLSDRMLVR